MTKLLVSVGSTPTLGRLALGIYRARICGTHIARQLGAAIHWLVKSKETTNFTYDLQPRNKQYLAAMIASIVAVPVEKVNQYIAEIDNDEDLRRHITNLTARSDRAYLSDADAKYGRRIGWYAIVRALKPKVVVETGVDKGLGSCVLASALKRNNSEGFEGKYFGTDINPAAGYLFAGEYANYGQILYGDSITSLNALNRQIDLFINDSDHSDAYEANEYQTIASKLSEHAIVLGDNAHCTTKLFEFSQAVGRQFIYFQEAPEDHWYPGGGIGFSFKR